MRLLTILRTFLLALAGSFALIIPLHAQPATEVEGRIVLHKAGLITLELPACMRARYSGVSSINSWRSIYYAVKVTVAVLIGALKDIPALPREMAYADTD